MAIRKVIESDISGKTNASTVTFGIGETWYEIDLTPDEQKKLDSVLNDYVKAGRKASTPPGRKPTVPDTTPEQREEIRTWAKANGFELADFGRIPKHIFAAYWDAHGGQPDTEESEQD